jgi:hypothetical protein
MLPSHDTLSTEKAPIWNKITNLKISTTTLNDHRKFYGKEVTLNHDDKLTCNFNIIHNTK